MKKMSGLMLSEIVTYIMLVMIAAAVAFGYYVSSDRDTVVEAAELSLTEIKAAVELAEKNGSAIACDSSLVPSEVLENQFLSLNIRPMPFDIQDLSKGYGVGVFVESKKEDSNDAFVIAGRLQKSLSVDPEDEEAEAEFLVRLSAQDEDEIAYGILISDSAVCASTLASNQ